MATVANTPHCKNGSTQQKLLLANSPWAPHCVHFARYGPEHSHCWRGDLWEATGRGPERAAVEW
eukprot:13592518-Alexandrium_andersonii.AAC.1